MELLVKRLELLQPIIEEIMSIAGTVGLSYGILHYGQVAKCASFGYRDFEKKIAVDSKTIFPICSLTKAMVAATVASLVQDGLLTWDTKIKDILPGFETKSEDVNERATISDLLSMRTGMHSHNLWLQSQNNVIFPRSDSLRVYNTFQQVQPLRAAFQYDNWAYEIAGQVIEKIVGRNWGVVLRERIFEPLKLERTDSNENYERPPSVLENVANAYASLDDATPVRLDKVSLSKDSLMGAAGGVQSCVDDLLVYYGQFLKAYTDQSRTGRTSTPESPFKQVPHLTSAHIPIPVGKARGINLDQAYGLGWVRSQLPGIMGALSPNRGHLGESPIMGAEGPERLVLSHFGSMAGAFSACVLFPETETAIVILTNSLSLSDSTDWVSQLLTSTIFQMPVEHDFVQWTRKTVASELSMHSRLVADLKKQEPATGQPSKMLKSYCGTYWNLAKTMFIEITTRKDDNLSLIMRLQGLPQEEYILSHHDCDVFFWLAPRNELVARGRFTNYAARHYRINFRANTDGDIEALEWAHVPQLSEGEIFQKQLMDSVS